MRKADCRRLAEDYRQLAERLDNPKDKMALLLMAKAWENAAAERERRIEVSGTATSERLAGDALSDTPSFDGSAEQVR